MIFEADALCGALVRRADTLVSCPEGSDEEAKTQAIADVYEAKRWPLGKEPGGHG